MDSMKRLYEEHAGKLSDKWSIYLEEYDRVLGNWREKSVRMLEVGVQNGGSLEIWSKYFPKAKVIVGCDINQDCSKLIYDNESISVVVGDANATDTRDSILNISNRFDLIIDDGSHLSSDIIKTFSLYFPLVELGGVYVIEDLHCSYWKDFGGGLFKPDSAVSFLKRLTDVLNYEHWETNDTRRDLIVGLMEELDVDISEESLSEIHSIEFVNSMCFIKKCPQEKNFLGGRVIAGSEAVVVSGMESLHGSYMPAPKKSSGEQHEAVLNERDLGAISSVELQSMKRQLQELSSETRFLREVCRAKESNNEKLKESLSKSEGARSVAEEFSEQILNSRSWRLTASIRYLGQKYRRARNLIGLLQYGVQRSGGVSSAIGKSFSLLKREGVGGVLRKIIDLRAQRKGLPVVSCAYVNSKADQIERRPRRVLRHQKKVDVIVCVHNALDDVKRCLESLLRNTYPPYHLILVDDGSSSDTKEYLKDFSVGQPVTLIRNEVAGGYTKAANIGLKASTSEYVILLNSDTIVPALWIDRLVECAESDEKIGIVGPLSNTASWQSVPTISDAFGDWSDNPLPEGISVDEYANEIAEISPRIYPRVGFVNGFCFLIKQSLLKDVGYFDEVTFARGYGEENDFCLRAYNNGWELAIADDSYVYHAQSKSYSHQRRKELSSLAGEALARKHGEAQIAANLLITQQHPALKYMRERSKSLDDLRHISNKVHSEYEGKRVLFVLPASTSGGGANIVLLEAAQMRSMGIDAWICNLAENKQSFESFYGLESVPTIYIDRPEDLVDVACSFDAIVATLYSTVYWMDSLRGKSNEPVLGYYIQDYEADFFAPGTSGYIEAKRSYTHNPNIRCFTKTNWNKDKIKKEVGVDAVVVGPSVDVDGYYPRALDTVRDIVNIVAMVRPSSPRRGPITTMKVLRALKEKYGDKLHIRIFGSSPGELAHEKWAKGFDYEDLGLLAPDQVKYLISGSDIFLDCSSYQAMGLTAMEAMAAGVAVVGPQSGGLPEIVSHEVNGLLVDTSQEDSIVSAVERLIMDPSLLRSMKNKAINVVRYSPRFSAAMILAVLFDK